MFAVEGRTYPHVRVVQIDLLTRHGGLRTPTCPADVVQGQLHSALCDRYLARWSIPTYSSRQCLYIWLAVRRAGLSVRNLHVVGAEPR